MTKANIKTMNERQLASCLNKTKWRELAFAMTGFEGFEPMVRLKYLGEDEPFGDFALLDWEWVKLGQSSHIEWMDEQSFSCWLSV